MIDYKLIAARLKAFRTSIKPKLTQAKVAEGAMVSQPTYNKMEKGDNRVIFEVIAYYVEEHDLNSNWLITGKGEMSLSGLVAANPTDEELKVELMEKELTIKMLGVQMKAVEKLMMDTIRKTKL